MRIVRPAEWKEWVEHKRVFEYADAPGSGHGFVFECDEKGNVDVGKLAPEAKENFEACVVGSVRGSAVVDKGVEKLHFRGKVPALWRCSCGHKMELPGFTNECECGELYNWGGQLLSHPGEWEDVWESPDDAIGWNGEDL